eukprot:1460501-Karenia_brevis.AAC.1
MFPNVPFVVKNTFVTMPDENALVVCRAGSCPPSIGGTISAAAQTPGQPRRRRWGRGRGRNVIAAGPVTIAPDVISS